MFGLAGGLNTVKLEGRDPIFARCNGGDGVGFLTDQSYVADTDFLDCHSRVLAAS